MERIELDVFSQESNYGIVRMPGRSFPGCVIQGDSLAILLRTVMRVLDRVSRVGDEELVDDVGDVVESLQDRLRHYESVLSEHSIQLPYSPIGKVP